MKKQGELRRHVLENEKALHELEANIEKSQKRAKDEQMECKKLNEEIKTLELQLAEQEATKAAEQRKIRQTSQYKEFLEAVVQECDEDFEGDIELLMNRHSTLEQGNIELHRANGEVSGRFDELREKHLREQSMLQDEHLKISSQLHECQRQLDQARTESQEIEQKLNRALEEKEKGESEVGVIKMAIEQLFSRTVQSCRNPQRKKAMMDATDIKYAPVRGDRSDMRFDEMLKQIGERVEDLKDMYADAREKLGKDTTKQIVTAVDGALPQVEFVKAKHSAPQPGGKGGEDSSLLNLSGGPGSVRTSSGGAGAGASGGMGGGGGGAVGMVASTASATRRDVEAGAAKQDTFLTQD